MTSEENKLAKQDFFRNCEILSLRIIELLVEVRRCQKIMHNAGFYNASEDIRMAMIELQLSQGALVAASEQLDYSLLHVPHAYD